MTSESSTIEAALSPNDGNDLPAVRIDMNAPRWKGREFNEKYRDLLNRCNGLALAAGCLYANDIPAGSSKFRLLSAMLADFSNLKFQVEHFRNEVQ